MSGCRRSILHSENEKPLVLPHAATSHHAWMSSTRPRSRLPRCRPESQVVRRHCRDLVDDLGAADFGLIKDVAHTQVLDHADQQPGRGVETDVGPRLLPIDRQAPPPTPRTGCLRYRSCRTSRSNSSPASTRASIRPRSWASVSENAIIARNVGGRVTDSVLADLFMTSRRVGSPTSWPPPRLRLPDGDSMKRCDRLRAQRLARVGPKR
jgi:hypothetical protein